MSFRSIIILGIALSLCACSGDDTSPGSNSDNIIFVNEPRNSIFHNSFFSYTAIARHKNGDPVNIKITAPAWLTYTESTNSLLGTPEWPRLNTAFKITVMATNGVDTAYQRTDVQVTLGEIICDTNFGNPETSKYVLPFEVGKTFKVNQTYCPPNPAWGHTNWFAYDFQTPIGTNVVAMRAGKVTSIQENKQDNVLDCGTNSGNFIFVSHSDGTGALYQHLKQNGVSVNVGDQIIQGQIIGQSGNSGCSSGPHLHVNLFRSLTGPFIRQYSLPFNFSNADGSLNDRKGLVQDGLYTAL